jgi:hypothetical protein
LKQWNAVRNLVGNCSGEKIYWFVEAWDGLKRRSVAVVMDFPLDMSMEDLLPSVLLDVRPLKTIGGACYLNSFSSLMAYLDGSVTTEEVFAFAMMGAPIV